MTRTYRSATLAEVLTPMTSKPIVYDNQIRSIRQATDFIEQLKAENERLSKMLLWAIPLAFFIGGGTFVLVGRWVN